MLHNDSLKTFFPFKRPTGDYFLNKVVGLILKLCPWYDINNQICDALLTWQNIGYKGDTLVYNKIKNLLKVVFHPLYTLLQAKESELKRDFF